MDSWKTIKSIINWGVIEAFIKKAIHARLDEDTKDAGLKMLEEKYAEKLLELPPDEIEKELIQIYIEKLKDSPENRIDEDDSEETDNEIDDEEFSKFIEDNAQAFPELNYITKMFQMNPEFKKMLKKLKEQQENDNEDDSRNNSMYI